MKIQVLGRVRPMYRGEGTALYREDDNRIAARAGGPFFRFLDIYSEKNTTYDVFKASVLSLVDVFMSGCNTSLLIAGETGSGKSFTMAGEGDFKAGIVPLIFDNIFSVISKENYNADVESRKVQSKISLQMFEVYNETVKDLLILPIGSLVSVEIQENAMAGVHLQNITEILLRDSTQAKAQFIQGWGRRTESTTDSGLASHNSAIFCQIFLERSEADPRAKRPRREVTSDNTSSSLSLWRVIPLPNNNICRSLTPDSLFYTKKIWKLMVHGPSPVRGPPILEALDYLMVFRKHNPVK